MTIAPLARVSADFRYGNRSGAPIITIHGDEEI